MDISKLVRSAAVVAAVLLGGAACATMDDSVLPQPDEPGGEGPAAGPAQQSGPAGDAEQAQAGTNASVAAGQCGCQGRAFVDEDGDGVCDHFQARAAQGGQGCGCGKGNGQGCGCGKGNGQGCGRGKGNGQGCGKGDGQGCGRNPQSPGFVDEDGDGVCDHFAARHGGPGPR